MSGNVLALCPTNSHGISYGGKVDPDWPWERVPTTFTNTVSRKYLKSKYVFVFSNPIKSAGLTINSIVHMGPVCI